MNRRYAYPRKHKYNVGAKDKRTRDGIVFDSIKEAKFYDKLKLLKSNGKIDFFLRQTPFHLAGGVTYRCDFAVFYADGQVVFYDVKGFKTPEYKMKKKLVEAEYGIEITEA